MMKAKRDGRIWDAPLPSWFEDSSAVVTFCCFPDVNFIPEVRGEVVEDGDGVGEVVSADEVIGEEVIGGEVVVVVNGEVVSLDEVIGEEVIDPVVAAADVM